MTRVVLIPVTIMLLQLVSMSRSKKYATRKDERSELMMFAFVGIIAGILLFGMMSRF